MATKTFDMIVVRHGEGFHNLGTHTRNELEFTNDDRPKTINSSLTKKGLLQANLVADRLKDTAFDLAITSDLKRATQTAEAIEKSNDSIKELVTWRLVRERCLGDFEGVQEVYKALRIVENAVSDRDYLTWRPPNGESVQDLRQRITSFLQEVQKAALSIPVDSPSILVSTHGLFMDELYYVISNGEYGKSLPMEMPGYQNTGIAHYKLTSIQGNVTAPILKRVDCLIRSCANHLENHDAQYKFCRGGCHGTEDDENLRNMDEQPR